MTPPSPAEAGTPVRVISDHATPSGTAVSIEALVEGADGDYDRVQIDPAGTDLCVASGLRLVVANPSGSIDDEVPETTTPTPPSAGNDGTIPAPAGDCCIDLGNFHDEIWKLADGTGLPVTARQVDETFALAEPHRPYVPEGGMGTIEVLRSYADQAADQSASIAAGILDNEEFRWDADGVTYLMRYCEGVGALC